MNLEYFNRRENAIIWNWEFDKVGIIKLGRMTTLKRNKQQHFFINARILPREWRYNRGLVSVPGRTSFSCSLYLQTKGNEKRKSEIGCCGFKLRAGSRHVGRLTRLDVPRVCCCIWYYPGNIRGLKTLRIRYAYHSKCWPQVTNACLRSPDRPITSRPSFLQPSRFWILLADQALRKVYLVSDPWDLYTSASQPLLNLVQLGRRGMVWKASRVLLLRIQTVDRKLHIR